MKRTRLPRLLMGCARAAAAFLFAAGLTAQTGPSSAPARADLTADTPGWMTPVELLNEQLPRWVQFDGQFRNRLERSGGIGFQPVGDTYDLTQLRLQVLLRPVRWLTLVGESQDAEVFFNQRIRSAPSYENVWDLRQAYVQLGDAKKGWFDLVVGRQVLSFGNRRVLGPSNWQNTGRTFDAVRADLHHKGYSLALFASSVIVARNGVIDHHNEGNNLHGAYGRMERLIPRASFEPYVFWRLAPARPKLSENAGRGALNEVTVGFLWMGKLPARFDYEIEMDRQAGSMGPASISAWAGTWIVGHTFAGVRAKPRLLLEGNYASGTKDPASRNWGTFDQLYPSSHNKLGFADQVGRRNIEQVRPGIEQPVGRSWKITGTYADFWLASARDALYGSSGTLVAQSPQGLAGRHVGRELDVWAEWKYQKTLEAGFGYAHFFAGDFLRRTTPGKDFNYPFAYLTYHFTGTPAR